MTGFWAMARLAGEAGQDHLGGRRLVAQGRVGAAGVVVPPPALDHDLGFRQRGEDLAVEQLVTELTPATPIALTASATGRPCAVSTSICLNLATPSSAVCRF